MIQAQELFVAQAGVFRGEVQVEDAEIAGLFDGTLTVRGNLVIRGTGKVNGVARYRKLSVEEGGQVSGRMEMLSDVAANGTPTGPAPAMPRAAVPPTRPTRRPDAAPGSGTRPARPGLARNPRRRPPRCRSACPRCCCWPRFSRPAAVRAAQGRTRRPACGTGC